MSDTVHRIVTERICALLEAGVCPWRRPWQSTTAQNAVSRRQYSGINYVLLNSLPFNSPFWLTYKQAKELGGSVKKGVHGFPVVFWKWLEVEKDGKEAKIPFLRYSTVFNWEQTEGVLLPEPVSGEVIEPASVPASYPAPAPALHHGGNSAFYRPSTDSVYMPAPSAFTSPDLYHSTLFHELVHSTGHGSRLDRFEGEEQFQFASDTYGREELVAELGAAFLCQETGISQTLQDSASYLASWLSTLKQPKNVRLIVEASAKASKAASFILGRLQTTEVSA